MSSLFFIRHSAVAVEPGVAAAQWHLSPEGRERARTLARQLALYRPTLFVTSEEPKAQETGQIMAETLGVAWRSAPNLHEHDRRGMPYITDVAQFKAAVARFFARPNDLVLGNETAVQARTRLATAVASLLEEHRDKRLAIVTHGTVLTALLAAHNPALEPFSFWRSLALPCALIVDVPSLCLRRQLD